MKLIKFLKNSVGAVNKLGLFAAAGALGLGVVTMTNYISTSPEAREQKVRSLAQAINEGRAPSYVSSGINLTTGSTKLATAQEKAAREGLISLDEQEDALSNMERGLDDLHGRALGAGTDGLGLDSDRGTDEGALADVMRKARATSAAISGAADSAAANAAAAAEGAQAEKGQKGTKINKLGSAEAAGSLTRMAGIHSKGHDFGHGDSHGFAAVSSAQSEASSRISPSMSGAMPSSSAELLSQANKLSGTGRSYSVGSDKQGHAQANVSRGKDNLAEIARRSGAVANSPKRTANEAAAHAFLGGFQGKSTVLENGEQFVPDTMATNNFNPKKLNTK